ncbi:MAG: 50S ribosomal protein L6 [Phycisphaerales bacterium]|nr:50S ribosomal protein L6 [Phycisphaerales bacterium]
MSRVGKKPISVPGGVKIAHDERTRTVSVEGPKGKLSFSYRPEVDVAWDESDKTITCTLPEARMTDRQSRAYWGTTRSRISNLVSGVTEGYSKKLEVIGVGWNAKIKGKALELNVGYCHPVLLPFPAGVEAVVEGAAITISGPDKQAVGQYAAVVRSKRPPEPYNGKGIKYSDEIIIRKQGKALS